MWKARIPLRTRHFFSFNRQSPIQLPLDMHMKYYRHTIKGGRLNDEKKTVLCWPTSSIWFWFWRSVCWRIAWRDVRQRVILSWRLRLRICTISALWIQLRIWIRLPVLLNRKLAAAVARQRHSCAISMTGKRGYLTRNEELLYILISIVK